MTDKDTTYVNDILKPQLLKFLKRYSTVFNYYNDKGKKPEELISDRFLDKWKITFTSSTVDSKNNYEVQEFIGDHILSYHFVMYLNMKFGDKVDEKLGTELKNAYLSESYQILMWNMLGFDENILRHNFTNQVDIDKMKEDTFEAFFSTLHTVADEVLRGTGVLITRKLAYEIYDSFKIDVESVPRNPVSMLNTLVMMNFSLPRVKYDERPMANGYKVSVVMSENGREIATAYGIKLEAKKTAAEKAIKFFEKEYKFDAEKYVKENREKKPQQEQIYHRQQNEVLRLVNSKYKTSYTTIREKVLYLVDFHNVTIFVQNVNQNDVLYTISIPHSKVKTTYELTNLVYEKALEWLKA